MAAGVLSAPHNQLIAADKQTFLVVDRRDKIDCRLMPYRSFSGGTFSELQSVAEDNPEEVFRAEMKEQERAKERAKTATQVRRRIQSDTTQMKNEEEMNSPLKIYRNKLRSNVWLDVMLGNSLMRI